MSCRSHPSYTKGWTLSRGFGKTALALGHKRVPASPNTTFMQGAAVPLPREKRPSRKRTFKSTEMTRAMLRLGRSSAKRSSCPWLGRTGSAGQACRSRWVGKAVSSTTFSSTGVTQPEIRVRLSACLRDRIRDEGGHPEMDDFLQPSAPSLSLGRKSIGSGLLSETIISTNPISRRKDWGIAHS